MANTFAPLRGFYRIEALFLEQKSGEGYIIEAKEKRHGEGGISHIFCNIERQFFFLITI